MEAAWQFPVVLEPRVRAGRAPVDPRHRPLARRPSQGAVGGLPLLVQIASTATGETGTESMHA